MSLEVFPAPDRRSEIQNLKQTIGEGDRSKHHELFTRCQSAELRQQKEDAGELARLNQAIQAQPELHSLPPNQQEMIDAAISMTPFGKAAFARGAFFGLAERFGSLLGKAGEWVEKSILARGTKVAAQKSGAEIRIGERAASKEFLREAAQLGPNELIQEIDKVNAYLKSGAFEELSTLELKQNQLDRIIDGLENIVDSFTRFTPEFFQTVKNNGGYFMGEKIGDVGVAQMRRYIPVVRERINQGIILLESRAMPEQKGKLLTIKSKMDNFYDLNYGQ